MEAESYAPLIRCPFLFLSATTTSMEGWIAATTS